MNCIQPTAPAEEGPRLVPKAVSIALIPARIAGPWGPSPYWSEAALVDRDQDRRHAVDRAARGGQRGDREDAGGGRGGRSARGGSVSASASGASASTPPSPASTPPLGGGDSVAGAGGGTSVSFSLTGGCSASLGAAGAEGPAGRRRRRGHRVGLRDRDRHRQRRGGRRDRQRRSDLLRLRHQPRTLATRHCLFFSCSISSRSSLVAPTRSSETLTG